MTADLLEIRRIYAEPAAAALPRFPGAEVVEVESHQRIDAALGPAARAQLAAEVIFLTHNRDLRQVNLGWHPKAAELLWRPELQQVKRSENGSLNVRYRTGSKGQYVNALVDLIGERLPYCRVRYAF